MLNAEMIKDLIVPDGLLREIKRELNLVNSYVCPACSREFDVCEVRKFTEQGEAAVCMECGEQLVAVDGD